MGVNFKHVLADKEGYSSILPLWDLLLSLFLGPRDICMSHPWRETTAPVLRENEK
jgi:hypothetical protein